MGNAPFYGLSASFLSFFLVFLKFACVLFAFEVKVERIPVPNGHLNSRGINAMAPSNVLAFVYRLPAAGTFGGLTNIACTAIIFALYLSALCVGGWAGSQGWADQKIARFWCTNEHHFYKGPYSSLISRVVVAEGHPETLNARSKPRVSPGWPGHAAGEARIPRLLAPGSVNP